MDYFVINLLNKDLRLYRFLEEGIRMDGLESDHVRDKYFYKINHEFCSIFFGFSNLIVQFSIYFFFNNNLSNFYYKLFFFVFIVITDFSRIRLFFFKELVVFVRDSWLFFVFIVEICFIGRSLTISTGCRSWCLIFRDDDIT